MNTNSTNTTISGDVSAWASLSTGITFSIDTETQEEVISRKKSTIKNIIDGDKYLLQEIITELRREKLDQLKNKINNI